MNIPGRGSTARPRCALIAITKKSTPASIRTSASGHGTPFTSCWHATRIGAPSSCSSSSFPATRRCNPDLSAHDPMCQRSADTPIRPCACRAAKALDAIGGRARQPAAQGLACFARPLRPAAAGEIVGLFEPVDRLVDVLLLELPEHGLRVRVAQVEMAVVQQEDVLDGERLRRTLPARLVSELQRHARSTKVPRDARSRVRSAGRTDGVSPGRR